MTPRPGTFLTRSSELLLGVCALGLLLAATPARANELQVLKQQLEAMQKKIDALERKSAPKEAPANAVTAGDFKGSLKLPGSDTSFSIYGYVKGDAIFNSRSAGGQNPIGDQFLLPSAIPVGPTAGANERKQVTLHARQTRLGIRSVTPNTPWGPLTTLFELDLFGASLSGGPTVANSAGDELVSNRNSPSLRHAYGTIGNLGFG